MELLDPRDGRHGVLGEGVISKRVNGAIPIVALHWAREQAEAERAFRKRQEGSVQSRRAHESWRNIVVSMLAYPVRYVTRP